MAVRAVAAFRRMLARILQAGPIPRHVAFIMDGNRRFADRALSGNVASGHNKGFDKLIDALEWCSETGIQCVSVYAFSIDNFNRSPEEVQALMELAETRLKDMLKEDAVAERHGMQICVIGDLCLLPNAVQQAASEAMERTKHHKKLVLNICLAYSSSQEMTQATQKAQTDLQDQVCGAEEASCSFEHHLYTQGCPAVDLLVRTSGECRLSDFLLWQSSHAVLHFTPVLWPDFSFWHLLQAIVSYQKAVTRSGLPSRAPEQARAIGSERLGIRQAGESPAGLQESCQAPARTAEAERPADDAWLRQGGAGDGAACTTGRGTEPKEADPSGLTVGMADGVRVQQSGLVKRKNAPRAGPRDIHVIATDCMAIHPEPGTSTPQTEAGSSLDQPQLRQKPGKSGAESSWEQAVLLCAPTRRNAANGLDRRKRTTSFLGQGGGNGADMFRPPSEEAHTAADGPSNKGRAEELRQNGFAGGYDSMDDEDDDVHVNGCPCCIVKFLPMHRICSDPVPAVVAMRK